jgi:hypothetical protein
LYEKTVFLSFISINHKIMAKKFNVTGNCFSDDHYMADVSAKLGATYQMIEDGEYFIINRPRQYGKTTTLYTIADLLNKSGKYLVFNMSFEGIGDAIFNDETIFAEGFVDLLAKHANITAPQLVDWLKQAGPTIKSLKLLDRLITELVNKTDKKVVVLIDEVDKSSNNQLFISFLAMLRNKYLERKTFKTFHSVVLAGVHDVKSLKLKLRKDETQTLNSPWNIATEFLVDMNLSPSEIKPMLDNYAQEQGIVMDSQQIAERLFYFSSGYPYLTSHLCKIIAEEILPKKPIEVAKEWTEADVFSAYQLLLRKPNNANFDTLIKNLREYPDLYRLVYNLVIDGVTIPYNNYDATMSLGILHGIFGRSEGGTLKIHNRIYREIIADMMISEWRTGNLREGGRNTDVFGYVSQYHLPNKGLDMQKVLVNFQSFMKKEYSEKDRKFLERDGRLIFLAFLKPIINGVGFDFKEPQISEEKQLDVVITYNQHQYVAELKIWHGEEAHKKGLAQLADYLDRLSLDNGFLLIFDHNQKKTWKKGYTEVAGKQIFWARV